MENSTVNLSKDEIIKLLVAWSDIGVLIANVINNQDNKIYPNGTLKYIYDVETDIINIKGLSNQNMNYTGTLEDFIKDFTFYVAKSQEINKRSSNTDTLKVR